MIPGVTVVCVSYLVLFMKTPNANATGESESWIFHQLPYVVDFLLIVQWIAVLVCWRKQKKTLQFLHDLTLSSKDKNLAQCNTSRCFEEKLASKTTFGFLFPCVALIDV